MEFKPGELDGKSYLASDENKEHTARFDDGQYTAMHRGVNHQGTPSYFAPSTERQGLVLFTKPDLNLSSANLSYNNRAENRVMSNLDIDNTVDKNATTNLLSAIRAYLDPRTHRLRGFESALVDRNFPFISMLTELVQSVSAPPEFTLETFVSEKTKDNSDFSMVDGASTNKESFNFEVTFNNIKGSPIPQLMKYWTMAIHNTRMDFMRKHPINIGQNRLDYMTRVWRLKFDETGKFVTTIAAYLAAFPLSPSLGNEMSYDADADFGPGQENVTIPFKCNGFSHNDPILYWEFNQTVIRYNSLMSDDNRASGAMVKIPHHLLGAFGYEGYPRIDKSGELEWWITKTHAKDTGLLAKLNENQ